MNWHPEPAIFTRMKTVNLKVKITRERTAMTINRPRVGLGVLLVHDNKILLGLRKKAHGHGCWGPPGGHLEFGESFEDCAIREVFEETNLTIKNVTFFDVTNDVFVKDNRHYVSIFMRADLAGGELLHMEPEKCERWEWFSCDNLPENLFFPSQTLLKKRGCIKL